jgi:hypothetical protein
MKKQVYVLSKEDHNESNLGSLQQLGLLLAHWDGKTT